MLAAALYAEAWNKRWRCNGIPTPRTRQIISLPPHQQKLGI